MFGVERVDFLDGRGSQYTPFCRWPSPVVLRDVCRLRASVFPQTIEGHAQSTTQMWYRAPALRSHTSA